MAFALDRTLRPLTWFKASRVVFYLAATMGGDHVKPNGSFEPNYEVDSGCDLGHIFIHNSGDGAKQ
jgi:hypothetical protein